MRGKIKHTRKTARNLYGADAGFVSLVDRGASETPFNLIKSESGETTMALHKRKQRSAKSHKKIATPKTAAKSDPVETLSIVAKMVFDADHFDTEDAVTEYLEKAEWDVADEDTVITETDEGYEVSRKGMTDDDYLELGEVELDEEGVSAFVGKVAKEEDEPDEDDEDDDDDGAVTKSDDEEEDEDDEAEEVEEVEAGYGGKKKPRKKAAVTKTEDAPKLSPRQQFIKNAAAKTKATKFDSWDARMSKGNSLAETIAAGMTYDSVPPGYYEVQAAFNGAMSNILAGDDMPADAKSEALTKAATDYVEIIGVLDSYFDAFVGGSDTLTKALKTDEEKEALAKWADDYGAFLANEDAPEAVKKASTVKKTATEGAVDAQAIATTVAEMLSKTVTPLSEGLDEVRGQVAKMAARRPSKKAADLTDSDSLGDRKVQSKKSEDEDAPASRATKAIFG